MGKINCEQNKKIPAKRFVFLKHTADVKFRAYGVTLEKAFENSALAMFSSMYCGKIKNAKTKKISVSAESYESLLYSFLEELLFLLDSDNFFISKIKVKINKINRINKINTTNKNFLEAEVYGDNAKNYPIGLDVKAVTYNSLFVKKIKNQWVCQVVVDV